MIVIYNNEAMPRHFLFLLLLVACFTAGWTIAPTQAETRNVEDQRRDYLAAVEALKAGNTARFKTLHAQLDGYILRGYLDYEYLKNRIAVTKMADIHGFLEENRAIPVSETLRKAWLQQLAARGNWDVFLEEFKDIGDDPALKCLRLGHLLKTSEQQAVLMAEVEALWMTDKSLPDTCNPVIAAWRKAGHMTSDKVWARIKLAMESRRLELAGELAIFLDPRERIWVKRWQAMYRDPERELRAIHYPVETPVARMIVTHGVVRLAYRDSDEAMQRWEKLKEKYQFFGEDDNYVLRNLGILAAQSYSPSALKWLAAVSANPEDESLQLWRVKAALRAGQWYTARRFIAGLSEERSRENGWRYWTARILEETNQKDDALSIYKTLAKDRDYYGFLAADRLGVDYSMQHISIDASEDEVSAMLVRPGIQMAQELYDTGQVVEARRQWTWITRRMNNRELQIAAVIARQWGWHDRAILTVAKSKHLDDLEMRFPLLYRDMIETNATEHGIDASWIYGVVRQESAFVVDARSQAGALGLMQLMPATGRLTGRRLNIPVRNNQAILNVENNLRLGVGYLKQVLRINSGNQILATASYNAGPNRVSGWMPAKQTMDADVWVETIPYSETREYVKNVMAFTTVYDYRLGAHPTRLSGRMLAITPAAE